MTDKEKIKKYLVEKLSEVLHLHTENAIVCREVYQEAITFVDSMDEEPVSEQNLSNVQRFGKNWKEPVSEDKMTISKEWFEHCKKSWYNEGYIDGKYNRDRQFEEPVSEDLGDYINELSKQFSEVSFAKLSRIAVRVAKWQKSNLWKPADGDDLPEIDREVIALLNDGKVVFAHRPPEYWDGKDIVTGKVTRHYPKTYDKGSWNIPNVKYWLDCSMTREIEL